MTTPRGNIARVIPMPVINLRNALMLGAQPTGNGPINNSQVLPATPGSIIILSGIRSAIVYRAFSDAFGVWRFTEVSPAIYFATEIASARQWRVTVLADLSWTVDDLAEETESGPYEISGVADLGGALTSCRLLLLTINGLTVRRIPAVVDGETYTFSNLPAGQYEVVAFGNGVYKSQIVGPIVVPSGSP